MYKNEASIRARLTAWIDGLPEQAIMVTDCPEADFFVQLRKLLPEWPHNLHARPMLFSRWSMGDEHHPGLLQLLDDFHGPVGQGTTHYTMPTH